MYLSFKRSFLCPWIGVVEVPSQLHIFINKYLMEKKSYHCLKFGVQKTITLIDGTGTLKILDHPANI